MKKVNPLSLSCAEKGQTKHIRVGKIFFELSWRIWTNWPVSLWYGTVFILFVQQPSYNCKTFCKLGLYIIYVPRITPYYIGHILSLTLKSNPCWRR